MADPFAAHVVGLEAPVSQHEVADFSSSDHAFSFPTRWIQIIGSGALVFRPKDSAADLSITFSSAVLLDWPIRVSHIRSTSAATLTIIGWK